MAGERILIADDEPDVLDVARFTLELEGYEVTTATNGHEAIECVRGEDPFALLLTDVKMPQVDGLVAFREIRRVDTNVVGVAMTGYGTMSMAVQALKQGFSDFLIKPFSPDDLTKAVNRALEKERLRRENIRLKALIPLFELSRLFMTETHLPTLLERVVHTGLRETGSTTAALLLTSPVRTFEVAALAGQPVPAHKLWGDLAADVLAKGQPRLVGESVSQHNGGTGQTGSVLVLPLFVKEQPLGVLVLHKAGGAAPFAEGDAELLNVMAGQAAVAIENARLFEEREAAYRELEQMDRMKSEFINIAAHELRTPLSLVLGYAALLESEVPEEAREYVQAIHRNGTRLQTIVDDMTNLRHLETNQAQLDLTPVDVRQVVQRVLELADPPIANRAVHVQSDFPDAIVEASLDVRKMELVVNNLLSNAYKFSPPDGVVTVRLDDRSNDVVLSVQDEGPGIPAQEQTKIWQRFYQVGDSLTRVHGGMGLGLAIVKGLVELHGGRAWVESIEGEGSTFYVLLPKASPRSNLPRSTARA